MKTLYETLQKTDKQIIQDLLLLSPDKTDGENYFYFENKRSPVLLMVHLDTVRTKHDEPVKLVEKNGVLINRKGVLGADCRAGLYVAMQHKENFNILVTNYEETGGCGAKVMIYKENLDSLLKHIRLIIALDRKGIDQYVYYNTPNDKVLSYIESFGFCEKVGSYNDCADITNVTNIPHVNISIGYYHQHTSSEYLDILGMELISKKLQLIADNPINKRYTIQKRSSRKKTSFLSEYWKTPAYTQDNEAEIMSLLDIIDTECAIKWESIYCPDCKQGVLDCYCGNAQEIIEDIMSPNDVILLEESGYLINR